MSAHTERDSEQDEMIRRNAESIRRNEEAILSQTQALEQIRDHYFPKRTLWAQLCGLFLKAVGAVTIAAGILEASWSMAMSSNRRLMGAFFISRSPS